MEAKQDKKTTSSDWVVRLKPYFLIIAIFSIALSLSFMLRPGLMNFMAFSLVLLASLKLIDIRSFIRDFSNYDLLIKRIPLYGYLYPFLELSIALGILFGKFSLVIGFMSTFIGVVGGISVFKVVYVEKLDLNCACVGGNQKVPLGFVSLSENAIMVLAGLYLILSSF